MIKDRLDPEFFQIRASQRFLESLHGRRLNQIHGAAPESATGHPRAQRTFDLHRAIREKIQLCASYFVVVFQAPMGFHQQPAHLAQVAFAAGLYEFQDPLVFAKNVPRAPLGYRITD